MRLLLPSIMSAALIFAAGTPDKPLPLKFVDVSKSDTSYSWAQVAAGNATLPVWNGEAGPQPFQAGLTPFDRDPDGVKSPRQQLQLTVSPTSGAVQPATLLSLELTATGTPEPGSYTGILTLSDPAKKLTPVQRQIRITVANPEALVSKLTATLHRVVPGGPWFICKEIDVPLRPWPDVPSKERIAGALRGSQGGWTMVRWKNPHKLEVDAPSIAGTYDGDLVLAEEPNKTALSVTVLVQDVVFWPILTIVAGIALAFLVKRYVGVIRVVWTLREQEAETGELYKRSERSFRAAAAGRDFAGYSIADDVANRRKAIDTDLNSLQSSWSTTIADNDPNYKAAVTGLSDLAEGLRVWGRLAGDLGTLDDSLDDVKMTTRNAVVQPPSVSQNPTAFAPIAEKLLTGGEITLGQLVTLSQNVAGLIGLAKSWPTVAHNLSNMTSEFQDLILPDSATTDQKTKYSTFQDLLEKTWRDLFSVKATTELDALTAIGGEVGATRIALDQLKRALSTPRVDAKRFGAAPGVVPQPAPATTLSPEADQLPPSDGRRAELLRRAIAAGDTGAAIFATLIALLTGLNTLYLGKAFGTIQDYVTLFLWAAGTKATLDILAGVLDKLAPSLAARQ